MNDAEGFSHWRQLDSNIGGAFPVGPESPGKPGRRTFMVHY